MTTIYVPQPKDLSEFKAGDWFIHQTTGNLYRAVLNNRTAEVEILDVGRGQIVGLTSSHRVELEASVSLYPAEVTISADIVAPKSAV